MSAKRTQPSDRQQEIADAVRAHGSVAAAAKAIGRTRQGKLFEMPSPDMGKTWGTMTLGTLPNPNSGIDALTL